MKKIVVVIIWLCFIFSVNAADVKKANKQLLKGINRGDMEQVVAACHNGADFMQFTDKQYSELNVFFYLLLNEQVTDVKTRIVFDEYNLANERYDSDDYFSILYRLAQNYIYVGDYSSFEKKYKEVLSDIEKKEGKNTYRYTLYLCGFATIYLRANMYDKAEQLFDEILFIYKNTNQIREEDRIVTYNNLAQLYCAKGDFQSAEILYKKVVDLDYKIHGIDDYRYWKSVNNLANFYLIIGNFEATESLLKGVESFCEKNFGQYNCLYILSLNNLGLLYKYTGDFEKANEYYLHALYIYEDILNAESPDLATIKSNIAIVNQLMGNEQEAIKYMGEAEAIVVSFYGKESLQYANILNNLANIYFLQKKNDNVIKSLERAHLIYQTILGDNHPTSILCLNSIAIYYHSIGDYLSAYLNYRSDVELRKELVFSMFDFMTEKQRNDYWKLQSWMFENLYPMFVFGYYSQKNSISTFAYDNELFLKGLLLNATTQVQNAVIESGNSELIDTYNKLKSVKERIIYLQQQPKDKQFGLDTLLILAEQLDKKMVLGSKEYRQNKENWAITWQTVQKKLQPNEVAIEFSSFVVEEDTKMKTKLVALLLRKESSYPEYIVLGNEEDIKELLSDDATTTYRDNGRQLYNKLWQPLTRYINEGEKVYFSPAGVLYQLNISALQISENEVLGDKYDLVQLSSTREIVIEHNERKYEKAVLYGGLRYDVENEDMLVATEQYQGQKLLATHSLQDNENRAGVSYLNGTKTEVEQIARNCTQHKIKAVTYTSIDGNEESFKALSGQKNNILHIATHGFFFTNDKAQKQRAFKQQMILTDQQPQECYIDPLLRAGLLLSGANKAWTGHRNELPEGVQDGILTAKEISLLDLRGADLVVLSACETGKGEITSDGVFGLQRAFKQAGAQTIIMSLWKVNDEATSYMMTTFYDYLLSGESKREAFTHAQQKVREKYNDPYYWAAFVMID